MEGMKKDLEMPIIKVKCSKCGNVEYLKISNGYNDQYPELQFAGQKNCTKCGKLLVVYISTYIEEKYEL